MPTLRSLQVEVVRFDGRFVVDTVLPALVAAGFDAPVALNLEEPLLTHGSPDTAAVLIEGRAAALEAVLTGKAPRAGQDALRVRARVADLRSLVRHLRPQAAAPRGTSRELGAEASAPTTRRKRDRVRTPDGRYIKGMVEGAPREEDRPAPRAAHVLAGPGNAPTDRLSFALHNLAAFLDANLARAPDASDDELVVVTAQGLDRG